MQDIGEENHANDIDSQYKKIKQLKDEISYLRKMLNLKRGSSSVNEILLKMRLLEKENNFLKENFLRKQHKNNELKKGTENIDSIDQGSILQDETRNNSIGK